MKEKDLYVEFEPQRLVYYVEKEDNTYGPVISGSQLSANYLDDFWEKRQKLELNLRNQIIENKISPVFYYMTLQELGSKDLASRVGLSYRKLQKVFNPESFQKLSLQKIKLFADVFNIPVANLFQSFLIKNDDREKISVEQASTANNLFCITKVSTK